MAFEGPPMARRSVKFDEKSVSISKGKMRDTQTLRLTFSLIG